VSADCTAIRNAGRFRGLFQLVWFRFVYSWENYSAQRGRVISSMVSG